MPGLGRTFCLGYSDQNIRLWFFAGGRARCRRYRRWQRASGRGVRVSATGTFPHEGPGRGSSGIVSTVAGMIMIARYTIRPLDIRTWDAFARLLDKHHGAGSAPRLVHLVSSAHRDEQQRRRRAGVQGAPGPGGQGARGLGIRRRSRGGLVPVRSRRWPSPPTARRDRSDRAAPGGAVVAVVSPDFRLRPPCPTDGGDSLACVADGRCYGIQGVGPSEEESAR